MGGLVLHRKLYRTMSSTKAPVQHLVVLLLALLLPVSHLSADPIDAVDDLFFSSEDFSVFLPILDNDIDTDGDMDTSTLAITQAPAFGTASIDFASGRIIFSADPNYNGFDEIRYAVSDTEGNRDTAIVTVLTYPTNDPPVLGADSDSLLNGGSILIDVVANDSDPLDPLGDIDPNTVSITTAPTQGSAFVIPGSGIFYIPGPGFSGLDSLTYEVCDDGNPLPALCSETSVYLTVLDSIQVSSDITICIGDDTPLLATGIGPFSWSPATGLSCTDCPNPVANPTTTTTYTVSSDFGGCCPHDKTVTVTVLPIDVVDANDDASLATEDTDLTFDVGGNDSGIGNTTVLAGPFNAGLATAGSVFTYTPNPGYSGLDSIQYELCPTGPCPGDCDTAWLRIDVQGVNDPPVTAADFVTIVEDSFAVVDVISNDSDVDGSLVPSSVSIISSPSDGIASVDPISGEITYTPDADFFGSDFIVYEVCDDGTPLPSACSQDTLFITVTPVNDAPIANGDLLVILEDNPGTADVLANDTDIDSSLDPASVSVVSGPANGSFLIDPATGSIDYQPDLNFNGFDTIVYQVCDFGLPVLCDTSVLIIQVLPVNDAPNAVDDFLTVDEDSFGTADVLANDSDVDGSLVPSSVSIVSGPSNGSAVVDPLSGEITYTPDPDYFGTDQLIYEVCDDGSPLPSECSQAILFIDVLSDNDAPIANGDILVIPEDGSGTADVASNDTDVEGGLDPTSVSVSSGPSNGSFTIDPISGEINYSPDPNFNGFDTIIYQICDAGTPVLCDTALLVIEVTPVNDPPLAVDDFLTTTEDIPGTADVLANDSDIDGSIDATTVNIISLPSNGSAVVDPVSGEITYTPDPDYNGPDQLVYEVCDNGTPLPGLCSTATLFIDVLPDNDAPVANGDVLVILEDASGTADVLANDTDTEGGLDPTSVSIISGPDNGSVLIDPVTGEISYQPDPNYNGPDSIIYEVCDTGVPALCDTAILVIDVTPVNDPPVAVDDLAGTMEGFAVGIDVLANDSDIDGNLVAASVTDIIGPFNGLIVIDPFSGTINYTPNPGFVGPDSLIYEVCDDGTPLPSECSQAVVRINVALDTVSNDPPVALDDVLTVDEDSFAVADILANDSDPEGLLNPSSVTVLSGPFNGSFSVDPASGEITYTPDPNYYGLDSIEYQVCDAGFGTLCATAWLQITVNPINDIPNVADDVAVTDEDIDVDIDVLANDSDIDGSLVTFTVTPVISPANGSLSVDALTGIITYSPNAGFSGIDSFSYLVCDDGFPSPPECAEATVVITVNPDLTVNLAPIAVNDTANLTEDSFGIIVVTGNDSDPDGTLDLTSVTVISAPVNGSFGVDPLTGVITYTPDANYYGSDSLEYQICDSEIPAACSSAWLIIDVAPVNDPPNVVVDSASTPENTPVDIAVLANDSDIDGSLVSFTLTPVISPSNGSFVVDALTGTITYTPDSFFVGLDSMEYLVCDDGFPLPSECAQAMIYIQVGPDTSTSSNLAPITINDSLLIWEDSTAVKNILFNDSDPEGLLDSTSVIVVAGPFHGSFSIDPINGAITYSGDPNYYGADSLNYRVCDGGTPSACDDAWLIIDVEPVNDAPVALTDSFNVSADIASALTVLDNDSDTDGSLLTSSLNMLTAPAIGSFTIDPISGVISYTPPLGFTGADSFQYIICDDGFPLPSLCDSAWVFVEVLSSSAGNIPPIAAADSFNVWEDSTAILEVLLNDLDPDGNLDTTSLIIIDAPIHGSAFVAGSGQINYQPDPNYFGADSFSYQICDDSIPAGCDTAWVIIDVLPINDSIQAVDDELYVLVDGFGSVNIYDNDFDVDGSVFGDSLQFLQLPSHGSITMDSASGLLEYTPDAAFEGSDSLLYSICDDGFPLPANCDSAWVRFYVVDSLPNSAPVAVNDTVDVPMNEFFDIAVLDNDFDLETPLDTPSLALKELPLHGIAVVFPTGEIRYTPDMGYIGLDSFTYRICDLGPGVLCDDALVYIEVTEENPNPPVAVNDTLFGGVDQFINFQVLDNDFDPDGDLDTASVSVISGPFEGTLIDLGDGEFEYRPNSGYCGNDSLTYQVCDLTGLCDVAVVRIFMDCDSFIAVNDAATTILNNPISIDVLANDDPRAVSSCLTIVSEPLFGTAIIQNDQIVYTPNPGYSGQDCLTYEVCDSSGTLRDQALVCIDIQFQDLFISNGVSPNGDGRNDFFTVQGIEQYPNNELIIFNRWGQEIYREQGYENDWDASYENKSLSSATFFYVLRLDRDDPASPVFKGSITVRK